MIQTTGNMPQLFKNKSIKCLQVTGRLQKFSAHQLHQQSRNKISDGIGANIPNELFKGAFSCFGCLTVWDRKNDHDRWRGKDVEQGKAAANFKMLPSILFETEVNRGNNFKTAGNSPKLEPSTSKQVWYVTTTPGQPGHQAVFTLTFNFNCISNNHLRNTDPMLIHNFGYFRLIITLHTVNFNIALGRQFMSARCFSHSAFN